MANNYRMVAKTLFGFEEVLAGELRRLGAIEVENGVRSVSFSGDKGFMYKANLCLRTALKIVKPLRSFKVRNEDDLYDGVKKIRWEDIMRVDSTLAVDAVVHSEKFNHSLYVALKTKDAVVDRFRELKGKRPDVDLKHPDLRINVHIQKDICTISLDSSGSSLHHRGYRTATNIAPINEVLAAGMLLLSGWDGQCDFLDPMCGSGTLPIEAAMIACNIPANINRREFAFEKWIDFDLDLFEKVTESSLNKVREFHHKILAFDKAPSAVRKASDNVRNANLGAYVQVSQQDFFKTEKQGEDKLHMVFNPPYGERLAVDMQDFYGNIGNTLKQEYPGTEAWLITSDMEALKYVGLRPSRKIKLFNGRLESRLVKYEMYAGSKKAKWQPRE
ncbi:THUMP domain-containing class I SAM-dependent RNA methyltransferase [Sinomicrobium soli]|uniref:THUMP domain-containing class I SAM-dependent RNA methyltransferase n=1 Tax=Sinomicrobium sp. N-1-3-6 TaxID=2219864 RepID=UPI000DCDC9BB|nr:THUMP domain-containing protein [Sinomicrobium sp. N-1-3-6]RAV29617.1 class I SAM-dependent RNA methyltransferase [Sinomicrobium sp. N-1-3-6]